MTLMHYVGALLVIVLIIGTGIYSGRQVKSAADFDGGHNGTVGLVTGAIIGTLVGGSSTIGTAQLAYTYGFSAWWFTLGGGIGVLVLGLVFAKPLYNSGIKTLPQLFAAEYGEKSSTIVALLNSLGTFLSIVAQILSGVALITAVSSLTSWQGTILTIVLMLVYVLFGGSLGAGLVGIVKTILMYVSVGICGIFAIYISGGLDVFLNNPALPHDVYFNLIARGATVDLGAGISLLLGVLTTQSYISAIITAKSLKVSRAGAILSAVLIPIIGVAGIFVGMYMRLNYPDIDTKMALPVFILDKMPPLVAGIMLATLLVAVVGTGAGLSLGMSSIFCRDIYKVYVNKEAGPEQTLKVTRMIIVVILVVSAIFSCGNLGDLILGWSFMSMGLRGSVAFIPLCTALFMPGKVPPKYAMAAMIAGPVFTLIGKFILPATIDSLFLGIAVTIIITAVGIVTNKNKR
ncbi:MAG: sodium:solute symporter [Lachnospiraceae bacterium]